MRATQGLFLAGAIAFGGSLAGAAPPLAAAVPECDGRGPICYSKEVEQCTKRIPCGYTYPFSFKLCCSEYETVTENWYLIEPD